MTYLIRERTRVLAYGHPLWGAVSGSFEPGPHEPRSEQEEFLIEVYLIPSGLAEPVPSTEE